MRFQHGVDQGMRLIVSLTYIYNDDPFMHVYLGGGRQCPERRTWSQAYFEQKRQTASKVSTGVALVRRRGSGW